jgi:hypothetical protein
MDLVSTPPDRVPPVRALVHHDRAAAAVSALRLCGDAVVMLYSATIYVGATVGYDTMDLLGVAR